MRRRDFVLALASLPTLALAQRVEATDAVAFAPVLPGRTLVFPDDHGATRISAPSGGTPPAG